MTNKNLVTYDLFGVVTDSQIHIITNKYLVQTSHIIQEIKTRFFEFVLFQLLFNFFN